MVVDEFLKEIPSFSRDSGIPAHTQIERWITDAITRGDLVPGDKFPGEREFAARLGVSRMTLRQALAGLERRGVIVRTTGRSGGSMVVEPKIECDLTGLAGFTEQMRRAHMRAGARVLSAQTLPAPRRVAEALELATDSPVHAIARIRSANGTPLALERSYFPAAAFPDLLEHRLTGSLYNLLGRHYGQPPHTAVESLEPVLATPDEASLLGVEAGTPLMLIQRTAYSVAGTPVEFARDIFRADRIRITVQSGIRTRTQASLNVEAESTFSGRRPRRGRVSTRSR